MRRGRWWVYRAIIQKFITSFLPVFRWWPKPVVKIFRAASFKTFPSYIFFLSPRPLSLSCPSFISSHQHYYLGFYYCVACRKNPFLSRFFFPFYCSSFSRIVIPIILWKKRKKSGRKKDIDKEVVLLTMKIAASEVGLPS